MLNAYIFKQSVWLSDDMVVSIEYVTLCGHGRLCFAQVVFMYKLDLLICFNKRNSKLKTYMSTKKQYLSLKTYCCWVVLDNVCFWKKRVFTFNYLRRRWNVFEMLLSETPVWRQNNNSKTKNLITRWRERAVWGPRQITPLQVLNIDKRSLHVWSLNNFTFLLLPDFIVSLIGWNAFFATRGQNCERLFCLHA